MSERMKLPKIGDELYEHYPAMSAQTHEDEVKRYAKSCLELMRAEHAAALAAERDRALEEAAKVAEAHDGSPCRPSKGWRDCCQKFYVGGQMDATSSVAAAIRALKETKP